MTVRAQSLPAAFPRFARPMGLWDSTVFNESQGAICGIELLVTTDWR